MIHLKKGQTSKIVVTLTEKCELNSPNYLFVFKSREDQTEVKFVLLNGADVSPMKQRYNEFNLNVDTYFANKKVGEWTYNIYEQVSTTNTNVNNTTNLVEVGQMTLSDSDEFAFTHRNTTNTFKVREI